MGHKYFTVNSIEIKFSMDNAPKDIVLEIVKYLVWDEIYGLRCTCKRYREYLQHIEAIPAVALLNSRFLKRTNV